MWQDLWSTASERTLFNITSTMHAGDLYWTVVKDDIFNGWVEHYSPITAVPSPTTTNVPTPNDTTARPGGTSTVVSIWD